MCNVTSLLKFICFTFVAVEIVDGFAYGDFNVTRIRREAANNGRGNGARKNQKCPNRYDFACKSGECINEDKECDGTVDCEDASDETNACHRTKCPTYLFRCKYGACIEAEKECDGKPDCRDKSDETSPKCKNVTPAEKCSETQFQCSSGQCIDEDLKCDGKADCNDNSDEIAVTCWNIRCPGYTYRCKYGACVHGDAECNGVVECFDGSDEDPKICKKTPPQSGSCVLPEHPASGSWSVFGSPPNAFSPGQLVDAGTVLQVNCSIGHRLEGDGIVLCQNGIWTPTIGICSRSSAPTPVTQEPDIAQPGSCVIPEHPEFGQWSVYRSNKMYFPGMKLADKEILEIKCNKGYALDGISSLVCMNGVWSSAVGKCLRTCPSVYSTPTLTVTCQYKNHNTINCTNAVDGTLAKFKCANFYEDLNLNRLPPNVCKDGSWNYPTPQCVPACGRKSVSAQTLIVNGTTVTKGDYPWQVALYRESDKELLCGGSLINQRVILTAAHCITDDKGTKYPKESYLVAVGKYYRKFDDPRDANDAQFSKLHDMFVPQRYKGEVQNYVGDIAVLVTIKTFILSVRVQPVCVDWDSNYDSSRASYGFVPGWGFTSENSNPSEVLKELKVPSVTYEACNKDLPPDYEIYLTEDKMCAGYLERATGVCRGDSGGGLVFKYDGRYYIKGIVSLAPQSPTGGCDSQQYGLYTIVSHYIKNNFIVEKENTFRPRPS